METYNLGIMEEDVKIVTVGLCEGSLILSPLQTREGCIEMFESWLKESYGNTEPKKKNND